DGHARQWQHEHDDERDDHAGEDVGDAEGAPQQDPDQRRPSHDEHAQDVGAFHHSCSPPSTASMYTVRSRRFSAARLLMSSSGPAKTVNDTPIATSQTVGTSIAAGIRPTSGRSSKEMSVADSSIRAEGPMSARSPSGASARARQNAFVQIRATTYSVSRLVTTPPATRTQA